ncbi:Ada metal-binding domain-containing protein [Butyrivibrio sp. AC2005]|uniref:Ada metal-binding domain-containing protein n=1 Tax=Butyrivibrio sp. AC2005 TaxID=1280672 RepID=UPI0003FDEC73|nr:Ada metal-binding domain-containing protein [Butyrivibrio sp. AC2005]
MSKIWAIVQWVLAGFNIFMAIGCFMNGGLYIISGVLFLALAVVISPLRKKIFSFLPPKFQNGIVTIVSCIVLMIGSFATLPSSQSNEKVADDKEDQTTERFVETDNSIEEASDEEMVNEDSNIEKLSFRSSEDIELVEGDEKSGSYLKAKVKDRDSFSESDVVFVSKNPEIATIEFSKAALTDYLYYSIKGISEGETEVYAMSKDGAIESEHVKVTVKIDEEKIAKEKEEAEKAEAEKKATEEAEKKAEEEKLAKEKVDAEAQNAENNEDVAKTTDEQTPDSAVASVAAPETEVPPTSEVDNSSSGDGDGSNFNTYNNPEQQNTTEEYVLNTSTKKFHRPSCSSVPTISPSNYATASNRDEIIGQGYQPCKKCNP